MLELTLDLNAEIKEINNLKGGDEFFISQIHRDSKNKQITVYLTKKKEAYPKNNEDDIKNSLIFDDDDKYEIVKISNNPTNILIRKICSIRNINFDVTVK